MLHLLYASFEKCDLKRERGVYMCERERERVCVWVCMGTCMCAHVYLCICICFSQRVYLFSLPPIHTALAITTRRSLTARGLRQRPPGVGGGHRQRHQPAVRHQLLLPFPLPLPGSPAHPQQHAIHSRGSDQGRLPGQPQQHALRAGAPLGTQPHAADRARRLPHAVPRLWHAGGRAADS